MIDAEKIVLNVLLSYNLHVVENHENQKELANEILQDLQNAGYLK